MHDLLPLEIDCATLVAWSAEPEAPLVLDVREPWEVAICALPNSLNIPLSTLPSRVSDIPDDRRQQRHDGLTDPVELPRHGFRSCGGRSGLHVPGQGRAVRPR